MEPIRGSHPRAKLQRKGCGFPGDFFLSKIIDMYWPVASYGYSYTKGTGRSPPQTFYFTIYKSISDKLSTMNPAARKIVNHLTGLGPWRFLGIKQTSLKISCRNVGYNPLKYGECSSGISHTGLSIGAAAGRTVTLIGWFVSGVIPHEKWDNSRLQDLPYLPG